MAPIVESIIVLDGLLLYFLFGQTTKVGRLAMADDKGGSPAKVGRPFVKFLQSKKYAYDYEHYIGISTRDQSPPPGRSSERLLYSYEYSTFLGSLFVDDLREDDMIVILVVIIDWSS